MRRTPRGWLACRSSATPKRVTISSISAAVTMNGGASITRSPFVPSTWPTLGQTTSPARSACSVNVSANFSARGSGARVRGSSTNSTPASSPRPRTSPDVRQLAQGGELRVKDDAQLGATLHQPVRLQIAQRRKPRGAGDRMEREGLGVQQAAGARRQHVHDAARRHDRRERRVARRDSLADRHEVGHDAVRLDAPTRCPSGPAPHKHLVGHEQHVVPVADLPHPRK